MSTQCPIVYDHDDDLGYCAVCGWTVEEESPAPYRPSWADLPMWLWPDHAIAPTTPITLCAPESEEGDQP